MVLLSIKDLIIKFKTNDGLVTAVNGFNAQIQQGETLGIVGESGSGKSQTVLAILRLLAKNAVYSGSIIFNNQELLTAPEKQIRDIRGNKISMIFQDPMTCLNPYMKIGNQLIEGLLIHKNLSHLEAKKTVLQCMDTVKIPDVNNRFNQYPHEFSGGMRQRIMIAMALLCKPQLLIADEPTTALDVTVQAEIMVLLRDLKKYLNMSMILITHDLGVIAGSCDNVIVLYGGRIMEQGDVDSIFYNSHQPYTRGLLASIPAYAAASDKQDTQDKKDLFMIPGQPPSLLNLPKGCPFYQRCEYKVDRCASEMPDLLPLNSNFEHKKACHVL